MGVRRAPWTNSAAAALTPFFVGVLWLAVMAFASAWPDMEASIFDSATTLMADAKLRTLRCPWIVSADEAATVSATFTNPTDTPVSFLVRTRVSRGIVTLVRQDSPVVKLAPKESRELSWPVAAADAAYGRVVTVRTLAMGSAARPARGVRSGQGRAWSHRGSTKATGCGPACRGWASSVPPLPAPSFPRDIGLGWSAWRPS